MKKFRLLGLILTLCMCFAIAMPAWAADGSAANDDVAVYTSEADSDNNDSSIEPRSTDLPKYEWNLIGLGDYEGSFNELRTSTMYTSRYFTPTFSYIFNVTSGAPRRSFVTGVYCLDCGYAAQTSGSYYTPDTPYNMKHTYGDILSSSSHGTHRCAPFVRNTSNSSGGSLIAINGNVVVSRYLGR